MKADRRTPGRQGHEATPDHLRVTRLLVVGGDAAGMSAAPPGDADGDEERPRPRRRRAEQTTHTSYSACGIPYWVGGEVATRTTSWRAPRSSTARPVSTCG